MFAISARTIFSAILISASFMVLSGNAFCQVPGAATETPKPAPVESKSAANALRFDLEKAEFDVNKPIAKGLLLNKKPAKRLPNFYKDIVDEKQRDEVYKIQADYSPLINFLSARIDALKKEQDDKIKAVLTKEQAGEIEKLTNESKAKRAEKAGKETPKAPVQSAK